jgi:hypothetical protein
MRSDAAPAVQKGSSSQFGVVKVDGTTITSTGGVISSTAGGGNATFGTATGNTSGNAVVMSNTTTGIQDAGYAPAPAGVVSVVTGSNPTTTAASWLAFTQYTIAGSGRTITVPATSGLSANGGLDIDANTNSVMLQANAADTITWAGSTTSTGGSVTLPAGMIYRVSTDTAGKLYVSGRQAQGNGAKVQLATGTTTTGNCVKYDANGNAVDAGFGCVSDSNWVAGNWYNAFNSSVNTGTNITATVTEWVPVFFDRPVTIGNIGAKISTASAGGNMQFSVYASGANGLPTGSALCTTASISMASTGSFDGACNATGSPSLSSAGRYWFGMQISDATGAVDSSSNAIPINSKIGANSHSALSGSNTNFGTEYKTTSGTYGTWPTNPTVTLASSLANTIPLVQFSLTSVP